MARPPDAAPAEHYGGLDIALLRENAPPADVRAATPAVDIREEAWSLPLIAAEARKTLAGLNPSPEPVVEDDTLIVAKGAWSAPRLHLVRGAPAGPGDSGWYLAQTDLTGVVALCRVSVRDLLEVRPDFREILTFPAAYLAVIGNDGIRSVYSPAGDDVWPGKHEGGATPTATG
jgi:hypothetical protein